jgi:epoxyqueuosine reductase
MTAALAFGDGLGPGSRISRVPTIILATIGRFARANWYAELVDRLGLCTRAARTALISAGLEAGRAGDWHRLVNSGLPERPLAAASGLGSPGRSGLLLVPGVGPGVVLGLLLVPFEALGQSVDDVDSAAAEKPPAEGRQALAPQVPLPGSSCGSCRVCIDACPTGALGLDGSFDRESCIQHWSSREGELPGRVRAAWRDSLYGCDLCTISCPRFSTVTALQPTRGILGEGLPAAEIATSTDEELRARLRGTALGMGWISADALRRNASLVLEKAPGSPRART